MFVLQSLAGQDLTEEGSAGDIKKSIRIGLLISEEKEKAALYGAEMAVSEANKNGGYFNTPFQLEVRSMEGPWGTGSKQAVNLIFDEEVWAIMGSHDGRNAHLVEQVTTKARIVFLSAWATDPTLSQAFTPWYFSCVPNDNQQADMLIEEVFVKRKLSRVAVIYESGYDSKQTMNSFLKKLKISGFSDPLKLVYDNTDQNCSALLDQISKANINCVILFGMPSTSLKLVRQIREKELNISLFGALSLLNDNELSDHELKNYEGVVMITPGHWLSTMGTYFIEKFQSLYGYKPGAVSTYAYDGMSIIIKAIREAGLDSDSIQKSLIGIKYKGVTGLIQFDENGNRVDPGQLMEIKNGQPEIYKCITP
jgi:branched-chain amino acid transport system substrate-binding protein